eukprot:Skav208910  [mRNA]  locus=scaffold270:632065:633072:- [translate_table: standard]
MEEQTGELLRVQQQVVENKASMVKIQEEYSAAIVKMQEERNATKAELSLKDEMMRNLNATIRKLEAAETERTEDLRTYHKKYETEEGLKQELAAKLANMSVQKHENEAAMAKMQEEIEAAQTELVEKDATLENLTATIKRLEDAAVDIRPYKETYIVQEEQREELEQKLESVSAQMQVIQDEMNEAPVQAESPEDVTSPQAAVPRSFSFLRVLVMVGLLGLANGFLEDRKYVQEFEVKPIVLALLTVELAQAVLGPLAALCGFGIVERRRIFVLISVLFVLFLLILDLVNDVKTQANPRQTLAGMFLVACLYFGSIVFDFLLQVACGSSGFRSSL